MLKNFQGISQQGMLNQEFGFKHGNGVLFMSVKQHVRNINHKEENVVMTGHRLNTAFSLPYVRTRHTEVLGCKSSVIKVCGILSL